MIQLRTDDFGTAVDTALETFHVISLLHTGEAGTSVLLYRPRFSLIKYTVMLQCVCRHRAGRPTVPATSCGVSDSVIQKVITHVHITWCNVVDAQQASTLRVYVTYTVPGIAQYAALSQDVT